MSQLSGAPHHRLRLQPLLSHVARAQPCLGPISLAAGMPSPGVCRVCEPRGHGPGVPQAPGLADSEPFFLGVSPSPAPHATGPRVGLPLLGPLCTWGKWTGSE